MTKPFRLPIRKRILTHPPFQGVATWFIAMLMKVSWKTYRISMDIHPDAQPYMHGAESGVFCFWHGRMIIFPCMKPENRPMHVLISHHRDGELITRVIQHFGVDNVRGSSSRGVRGATRSLATQLNDGHNISITPDGPRGPVRRAQKGAVLLAQQSQKPIIPVSFSARPFKTLNSWDRFMVPLPFCRVLIMVGQPIRVAEDCDKPTLETSREQLEQSLNRLTDEADKRLGLPGN